MREMSRNELQFVGLQKEEELSDMILSSEFVLCFGPSRMHHDCSRPNIGRGSRDVRIVRVHLVATKAPL